MLAKFLGKPTVLTTHHADVLPMRNRLYSLFKLLALRTTNIVTAVSFSTLKATIKIGADKRKALVIYNSINESIFKSRPKKEVRHELNLDLNKKIVLYVGYLTYRKNVRYLINSIKLVLIEFPNTTLLIIGDGPQKKDLELIVNTYHLEKSIRFMSNVPTNMLALYYNASDVFVLPSLDEGHSMVLLEAMASGLPLVATKVGGNIETIVDGKNGYLIKPSDTKMLSDKIKAIFADETLARDFGEKSYQIYIEKFSEAKQMKAFNRIYSSIIIKTERDLMRGFSSL